MFTFGWLQDRDRIIKTLTDPYLWPWISFDNARPEDMAFPEYASFLGAWDGNEYLGMYAFERISDQLWRSHVHLLPNAKGRALDATKQALQWLHDHFENLICLVGETPSSNRLAVRFKTRLGFKEVGRLTDVVTQSGELQDIIISEYRMR